MVRGSRSGCVSGCGPGARRKLRLAWLPAENGAQAKALPVAQGRLRAAGGRANWAWTPACWREARRLQTSTLGPGMQEPGPSSIGGKTFCPPSAAFQGSRLPGRTPCHRPSLACLRWPLDLGCWQGRQDPRLFSRAATQALVSSESAGPRVWPRPTAAPAGWARPEGRPPPLQPAPCWQSQGRTAGAWGRSPRAAGSPQLLAAPKDDHLSFN